MPHCNLLAFTLQKIKLKLLISHFYSNSVSLVNKKEYWKPLLHLILLQLTEFPTLKPRTHTCSNKETVVGEGLYPCAIWKQFGQCQVAMQLWGILREALGSAVRLLLKPVAAGQLHGLTANISEETLLQLSNMIIPHLSYVCTAVTFGKLYNIQTRTKMSAFSYIFLSTRVSKSHMLTW